MGISIRGICLRFLSAIRVIGLGYQSRDASDAGIVTDGNLRSWLRSTKIAQGQSIGVLVAPPENRNQGFANDSGTLGANHDADESDKGRCTS